MSELARPTAYFTREEIQQLRVRSAWRSSFLIAHCWLVIFATWAVVVMWTNPITIVLGIMIVGGRQLGLAILNHDGAHYLLYDNKAINDWVSEWLLNRPLFGGSVVGYRKYHLEHHRFTQQANDPDLHLSEKFPITRASFRRKAIRDLTGQTGWKQHSAIVRAAFGSPDLPWQERLQRGLRRLGPNLVINLVFLTGFAAAGYWWLYFLLWVVPAFTWERFITRLRNIGEHAVVPDNNDRLRNTRTTRANWLERAVIAPYFVNLHLEHHLLVSCPCYNLPKAHRMLIDKGLENDMEIQPGYRAVINLATAA
ncbi:MAG: fatty acid desaturase family protein [Pseudomonadaceae bacterium]|nr:fatty acid desaturase family protein [Pseudomonadaceae bacterium]